MFCSKCGTETPDDSQFCRKCGKSLTSTSVGGGAAVAPAPVAAKPPSKVRTPFKIAAVLVFAFLAFVAYMIYEQANRNAASNHASVVDQIAKQQRTVSIDKPDAEVNAASYYFFKLQVPPGATSVHLQGSFTASGGSGNDVQVFVLPEDDFMNWQNRHVSKSYYNSGKTTVGNFSVNLPSDAANYYLVFDNRFSLFSKKEIAVKGSLTYYQ
jgi:zinc ribbon protein